MKLNVSKGKIVGAVVAVVFVLSVVGNVYLFMQYQKLSTDPQKQAQQEMQNLVSTVSQLMILPEGEDPTVATVADTEKLKDQPFFSHAQIGDKVLLYTTAKKAILYRPSANKIIEVAPINLGAPATGTGTDTAPKDTTTPEAPADQATQ